MTTLWTLLAAIAVLWPSRALSAFDGVPLSGRAEAVLIGIALPALWWLHRGFLRTRGAQAIVAALLVVKAIGWVALPQQGLCAHVSTAPFKDEVSTIAIDEPDGILRSWDVRADWRAASPRCTAILDRSYRSETEFPAWFLNLVDAIRPGVRDFDVRVTGYADVARAGTLEIETGRGMTIDGTIGPAPVAVSNAGRITAPLSAGVHAIDLHAIVHGDDWKLVPTWNGRDAWSAVRFSTTAPGWFFRAAAPMLGGLTVLLAALLCAAWTWSCARAHRWSVPVLAWSAAAAALLAGCGASGRFDRAAAAVLLLAVFVPVARRERNRATAFLVLGVPWLALFAARSWSDIGQVTLYSRGDDWQMYQLAAYRIVLNGYWLQGGSSTFLFQPLYRWVVGVLHLTFGDSSIGETYLDAICLLGAALLSYAAVKRAAGYRWGIAAASLTLVTFCVSPIWYLIGRGLAEITGLGMMSMAALLLMRARRGSPAFAAAAAAWATLMLYTRLNHLLVTAFLLVWLLPLRTSTAWHDIVAAAARVQVRLVAIYAAVIAAGVVLFAAHTWWYAGHFSFLYGTSFGAQQTGFQLPKIVEALGAQVSMREPPALDPRSTLVAAGALLAVLAVLQLPIAHELPAPLTIMTVGTLAGSVFAYTHDYPGRMSVHVVPFAIGVAVCAAAQLYHAWARRSRAVAAPTAPVNMHP